MFWLSMYNFSSQSDGHHTHNSTISDIYKHHKSIILCQKKNYISHYSLQDEPATCIIIIFLCYAFFFTESWRGRSCGLCTNHKEKMIKLQCFSCDLRQPLSLSLWWESVVGISHPEGFKVWNGLVKTSKALRTFNQL